MAVKALSRQRTSHWVHRDHHGADQYTLWVCQRPNMYVLYPEIDRKMLVNVLTLEEINLPLNYAILVMVTCNTLPLNGNGHMTSGSVSTPYQYKAF